MVEQFFKCSFDNKGKFEKLQVPHTTSLVTTLNNMRVILYSTPETNQVILKFKWSIMAFSNTSVKTCKTNTYRWEMAAEISAESSAKGRKHSGVHQNRTPTQHLALGVAAVSDDGLSNTCSHVQFSVSIYKTVSAI